MRSDKHNKGAASRLGQVRCANRFPRTSGADKAAHPRSSGTFTESCAPFFKRKGRLQPGCDADIKGMRHVLVNGQSVISDCILDQAAAPGRPIRRGDA